MTLFVSISPALTFLETAIAVESLLNKALVDDTLDDGYVSKFHQRWDRG